MYITLSHLRSKEFQRIHLPCIPQHRETSNCTPVYIEMYPGKVVTLLKEQATFIKASMAVYYNNRSYNVTCCLSIIESFRHAYITNPAIPLVLALSLSPLTEVLHISCNMGTRDLPEMYARSPRAAPLDFGHIFLANHSCPCYNYKI